MPVTNRRAECATATGPHRRPNRHPDSEQGVRDVSTATATDLDVALLVDSAFDTLWKVTILDSDKTTYDEVIVSCIVLFGFTPANALQLAHQVNDTGEADAHVCSEQEANQFVVALRRYNVRAEARKA
jgi:ATP-dependent Clp protease adapter protein ClpS